MHDRAATPHRDGHARRPTAACWTALVTRLAGRAARHRMRLDGRPRMSPDELPCYRDLLRAPGEGPGSGGGRHTCRAVPVASARDSEGRTGHLASTIPVTTVRMCLQHSAVTSSSQQAVWWLHLHPPVTYWLRVTFLPLAEIDRPCWVTLMVPIDTPAGSLGRLMLKLTSEPRTEDGSPPKLVILMLTVFGGPGNPRRWPCC